MNAYLPAGKLLCSRFVIPEGVRPVGLRKYLYECLF